MTLLSSLSDRGRAAALGLCLPLLAASVPAIAAPPHKPSAASVDEASKHFKSGVKLYDEQDFRAALVEFKRAYEIAPSWAVLFNIAQSSYSLQDYAGALAAFERYLGEGGGKVPPERRQSVTRSIEELRGRVARVTITTSLPDAEISIDDVAVGRSPLGGPQLLSAGRRKLTATHDGVAPINRVIDVAGGDALTVDLPFSDPSRPPDGPHEPTPPPVMVRAPPSPLAYVALGVGGAGLIFGSAFGALALGSKGDLDKVCANKSCPTSSQGKIDAMKRDATLSTVGLVVGAVGVGAGLYLLFSPRREVEAPAAARGPALRPWIGLGSAGVDGRF